MNLAAFAMKYRPIVITVTMLLMLWGVISVMTMPRREDPRVHRAHLCRDLVWPGAPAEQVEKLVTKPLEEAIDSIDEVDVVYSETNVGISTIYVDAEDAVSAAQIDNVWDKVRARVQRVEMPDAAIVPDVNDEFGDTNVIVLCVYQQPLPGEDDSRGSTIHAARTGYHFGTYQGRAAAVARRGQVRAVRSASRGDLRRDRYRQLVATAT